MVKALVGNVIEITDVKVGIKGLKKIQTPPIILMRGREVHFQPHAWYFGLGMSRLAARRRGFKHSESSELE